MVPLAGPLKPKLLEMGAGDNSCNLANGIHVCCVDCLNGGDGTKLSCNQVKCLVGLAIFLHQQEAKGGEDLAIEITFHDGLLDAVEDAIIRIDVAPDSDCNIASDVGEDVALGADGERDRFEVDGIETSRASSWAVEGEEREQATITGSDGCLRMGAANSHQQKKNIYLPEIRVCIQPLLALLALLVSSPEHPVPPQPPQTSMRKFQSNNKKKPLFFWIA
jgi:hypothetical protein